MFKYNPGWTILAAVSLVFADAESFAAGGNCPSAPMPYDTASCHNFCWRNPVDKKMTCDVTAEPGNNVVVVVKNYKTPAFVGVERYSAWGTAGGQNFCCVIDSTAGSPIDAVDVLAGSGEDEIWFTATNAKGVERNLTSSVYQTVTNWFVGTAFPGDGNDLVNGSNSTASDYMDHLTGENGADVIHGNKGADFISVAEMRSAGYSTGNHGESVYGDNGRDEIVGATNDPTATDTIFVSGGSQNDLLCTGGAGLLTGQKVDFFGGNGDDEIYSMSDGPIDGEAGADGCDNPGGGVETSCSRSYNGSNFSAWSPMVCPP